MELLKLHHIKSRFPNYQNIQTHTIISLHLVVIHDSVEGLDPHGVNVSIQNNPFWVVSINVGQITHDA